jgi:Flp pilus assembly protein TadG
MIRRILGGAKGLLKAERGVSVVEFALIAPLLAFIIVGITDLARAFGEQLSLEQAVHRALEKAAVGSVKTDYTDLRVEAAAAAGVPVDNVVLDNWLECDRARQAAFEGTCEATQMTSRYVSLRVSSKFKPMFAFSFGSVKLFQTGADGTVAISARSSLRVQ